MTASFFEKSVYGKVLIYPMPDDPVALGLCKLLGKKTVDENDIRAIRELKITVVVRGLIK